MIIEKITNHGPILSRDLIQYIISKENISDATARQRLFRATSNNPNISKITYLFKNREILFYKKAIYGSENYYYGLYKALKEAGKQYYIILKSLGFNHGQIPENELASYSINTKHPLKGHLTLDTVISNLINAKLIRREEENIFLEEEISMVMGCNINPTYSKSLGVAKNFLLDQFTDWSKSIGLVSYNSIKHHSEFGKYQFNFVAPSYIGSLPKKLNDKIVPSFVIADILIDGLINIEEIDFVIKKIDALKAQKQSSNFIYFVIVDSLDTKALNALKAKGVIIAFADKMFGENYKELLKSLINLVINAGAILKKNPDEYLKLTENLNKLVKGKTNNLKGDLFELAVGYYYSRICQNIDIGKKINQDGNKREIDVLGITNNEIHISECKGYNHKIQKDEIDKWLGTNIPPIRKWLLSQDSYKNKKYIFTFWSTGGFTEEALELLQESKKSLKKYDIEFYDLNAILEKSKEVNSKKFTEIIREYYIKI